MTADPDPPFVAVWNNVVAELNGDTDTDEDRYADVDRHAYSYVERIGDRYGEGSDTDRHGDRGGSRTSLSWFPGELRP